MDLMPEEIDGVPTDVVEIGEVKALGIHPLAHVTRVRPLVAEVSIGNWAITAGTLGWFFRDGRGREMLGSNAHVLAEDPLSQSSGGSVMVTPINHTTFNLSAAMLPALQTTAGSMFFMFALIASIVVIVRVWGPGQLVRVKEKQS